MAYICTGLKSSDDLYNLCNCPDGFQISDPKFSACNCAKGVRSLDEQTKIYKNAIDKFNADDIIYKDYLLRKNQWDNDRIQHRNVLDNAVVTGAEVYLDLSPECGGCFQNTFNEYKITVDNTTTIIDGDIFTMYGREQGGLEFVDKFTYGQNWSGFDNYCRPGCRLSSTSVERMMNDYLKAYPPPAPVSQPIPPAGPSGNTAINCCSNYMNIGSVNKIENVLQNCNQSIIQSIENNNPTTKIPTQSPVTTTQVITESPVTTESPGDIPQKLNIAVIIISILLCGTFLIGISYYMLFIYKKKII